jgi:hypothetical protein
VASDDSGIHRLVLSGVKGVSRRATTRHVDRLDRVLRNPRLPSSRPVHPGSCSSISPSRPGNPLAPHLPSSSSCSSLPPLLSPADPAALLCSLPSPPSLSLPPSLASLLACCGSGCYQLPLPSAEKPVGLSCWSAVWCDTPVFFHPPLTLTVDLQALRRDFWIFGCPMSWGKPPSVTSVRSSCQILPK